MSICAIIRAAAFAAPACFLVACHTGGRETGGLEPVYVAIIDAAYSPRIPTPWAAFSKSRE
jgi:hypothetical protein